MIKVTTGYNASTGVSSFNFECSSADDYETLDKLRVLVLGDHPKRGNYENSNTLVIETKVPTIALS